MTPMFSDTELETLLCRPVRRVLTAADRRGFTGRRVLITGAGGSVGSELARQIALCGPALLVLLDQSEFNLFDIERDLVERVPGLAVEAVLGDVTNAASMRRICHAARPHVVYHAAAYKHVSMVERAVCAATAVNVLGTANAADAANAVDARFVLISSDKAAAPRSVMGATKRLAEIVVMAKASDTFRPIVVRFGNVLGSSGSVLTIMRDHIRRGRAVSLTDPRASRYFMTADEAVSLVMKADLLATRAETYWLDMGEPVQIGDLAERLMALERGYGFPAVPIELVGLRPGEKLREELTTQGLRMCRTRHPQIWMARQRQEDAPAIDRMLKPLHRLIARGDAERTLDAIAEAVPEFEGSEEAWALARAQSVRALHRDVRPQMLTA
jgi:FlaA1/EpsC-like NDP-sugar epimerase